MTSRGTDLPPRELVAADDHWRVVHAFSASLPGWLVLLPRRHVEAIVELTDAEAEALGRWQLRLSRALHRVLACQKTYVAQFSEAAGHHHLHFHVVPRMADQPDDRRGPATFGYLTDPANAVSEVDRDALAIRLRAALAE